MTRTLAIPLLIMIVPIIILHVSLQAILKESEKDTTALSLNGGANLLAGSIKSLGPR